VSQAATFATPTDVQAELVETIRRFVEREVVPVASKLDHDNEYPHQLVARMRELGLFGATIPTEYGGLGLDVSTYAMIIEELCVGWMTLSGILNTHLLLAYMIRVQGTDDQKQRYLSKMAKGEFRGALCLTESHAGSDVLADAPAAFAVAGIGDDRETGLRIGFGERAAQDQGRGRAGGGRLHRAVAEQVPLRDRAGRHRRSRRGRGERRRTERDIVTRQQRPQQAHEQPQRERGEQRAAQHRCAFGCTAAFESGRESRHGRQTRRALGDGQA